MFTKDELEAALRPVFDTIWHHPDAWPFQEPVNPERLNIPVRATMTSLQHCTGTHCCLHTYVRTCVVDVNLGTSLGVLGFWLACFPSTHLSCVR